MMFLSWRHGGDLTSGVFVVGVALFFSGSDYFKLGCVYIKLNLFSRAFSVALYRHSFDVTCKNIHNLLFYVHFFILIGCIKHAAVISQILLRCVRALALNSLSLWCMFIYISLAVMNTSWSQKTFF